MNTPGTNTGHGHVWARPDGLKARCGGPALCRECARDTAAIAKPKQDAPTDAEITYEVWQNDMIVATSTDLEDASHYAAVYSQDGPVKVYTVRRSNWEGPQGGMVKAPAQDAEQPENIRTGYPYDDPAFEALAREHDVWGRASGALCAVFWRAARVSGEQARDAALNDLRLELAAAQANASHLSGMADYWLALRDVPDDLLGETGIPCVAVSSGPTSGRYVNGEDAEAAVRATLAARALKSTSAGKDE
jgi:hypothetical protein